MVTAARQAAVTPPSSGKKGDAAAVVVAAKVRRPHRGKRDKAAAAVVVAPPRVGTGSARLQQRQTQTQTSTPTPTTTEYRHRASAQEITPSPESVSIRRRNRPSPPFRGNAAQRVLPRGGSAEEQQEGPFSSAKKQTKKGKKKKKKQTHYWIEEDRFFFSVAKGSGNSSLVSLMVARCLLYTLVDRLKRGGVSYQFNRQFFAETGDVPLLDFEHDQDTDGSSSGDSDSDSDDDDDDRKQQQRAAVVRLRDFFDDEAKLVEACKNTTRKFSLRTVLDRGLASSNWMLGDDDDDEGEPVKLSQSAQQEWPLILKSISNLEQFDELLRRRFDGNAEFPIGDLDDLRVEVVAPEACRDVDESIGVWGESKSPVLRPAIVAAMGDPKREEEGCGHLTRRLVRELWRYRRRWQYLRRTGADPQQFRDLILEASGTSGAR